MGMREREGKAEDIDDMASSTLFMRTFRNLYLHLVEEQCQFCPGDMDQARLPVSISPFPIIHSFWSLMADSDDPFYICEGTITLPLGDGDAK